MKTVIIFAIAFGDAGGAEETLHLNFLNHLKVFLSLVLWLSRSLFLRLRYNFYLNIVGQN